MLSGTMGRWYVSQSCHVSPLANEFNSGVDILIATPGRLCDHIASGNAKLLEHLQYLVSPLPYGLVMTKLKAGHRRS